MSKFKWWKDGKHHYVTAFKVIELGNTEIVLVKKCPCNDKEELSKIEGEFIRSNPCVNKVVAGRTHKEYYIDNRDKLIEKSKAYYNANKDKVMKHTKEYYENNKDKINMKKKQYYEKNKDSVKQYIQNYQNQNKDKIKAYKQ